MLLSVILLVFFFYLFLREKNKNHNDKNDKNNRILAINNEYYGMPTFIVIQPDPTVEVDTSATKIK